MNFKDIAVNLISSFGYIGLGLGMLMEFIGLPFPGEIALGFAGFMVWRGVLEFTPTLVAALGFSWLGSMLAYFLGASLGRPFVLKYGKYGGLDEEKMEKVEEWFSSRRVVVLIFGRFPWLSFSVLSFIGTALWSTTFLSAGMFLGAKWESMESYSILLGLFFFGLSVILIYYLWRRKNKQEENND